MRRAMHIDPVFGQALQARDLVAHFVVQNLRAATRNRIQPRIPQPHDRVTNAEIRCTQQSQ